MSNNQQPTYHHEANGENSGKFAGANFAEAKVNTGNTYNNNGVTHNNVTNNTGAGAGARNMVNNGTNYGGMHM